MPLNFCFATDHSSRFQLRFVTQTASLRAALNAIHPSQTSSLLYNFCVQLKAPFWV